MQDVTVFLEAVRNAIMGIDCATEDYVFELEVLAGIMEIPAKGGEVMPNELIRGDILLFNRLEIRQIDILDHDECLFAMNKPF